MSRPHPSRWLAVVMCLGLVLAACGDDGGDGGEADAGGDADAGAEADADGGDGGEADADPGGDTATGSASGFCGDVQSFQAEFDELEEGVGFGDPELMGQIQEALASLEPPEEIADDFETLREGINTLFSALEEVDPEDPSSFEDIDPAALEALEGEEYQRASENVDEYLVEECGIDTGTATTGATGTDGGG